MSSEGLTWLRVSGILEVVITDGKLGIWLLNVRIVNNAYIAATENGSFVWIASYCKLGQIKVEPFPHVHREYKRGHRLVCCPVFFGGIPSQRGVSSNDLSIFRLKNGESLSHIIAFFMEFGHWKIILAGPVEKGGWFEVRLDEERPDVLMIFSYLETESWNFVDLRCVCGDWHFRWFEGRSIEAFDVIKMFLDVFEYFLTFVIGEVCFKGVLLLHEEYWENLIHINSWNVIVVLFVDEVDEVHGLVVETKETNPLFKVQVLFLHFFDDWRKQVLQLFLQLEHLRDLGIGVFTNYVFQLRPLHLLTFVVE